MLYGPLPRFAMNRYPAHLPFALTAACVLVLLSGCGTAPASRVQDRKELEDAKACCQSSSELPAPVPLIDQSVFLFAKDSPHFDFGRGLAPFARFSVDGRLNKHLALIGMCRLSGLAFGGDGMTHCVDIRVTFFDAAGSVLEHRSTVQTFRNYNNQMFNLTTFHDVPAEARSLVIAADPRGMGAEASALGRYTAYGTSMTVSSGAQIPYVRTVYGSITAVVAPTLAQASRGLSN